MPQNHEPVDPPSPAQLPGKKDLTVKEEHRPGEADEGSASEYSQDSDMAPSKARDPDRPKRKKASRACAACQRAHLTCSDNRPCERCVARHMADTCHDGQRKKAKYLHDAPPEALIASHGAAAFANIGGYQHASHPAIQQPGVDMAQPSTFTGAATGHAPSNYPPYRTSTTLSDMPPPPIETQGISITQSRQSPSSSAFNSAHASPMQPLVPPSTQLSGQPGMVPQYLPDGTTPGSYNFDLSGMNFGNHYGALEFGMLEHMTTNAQEDAMQAAQPPTNSLTHSSYDTAQFAPRPYAMHPNDIWATSQGGQLPVHPGFQPSFEEQLGHRSQTIPHAFAIGVGNGSSISGASPASSGETVSNGETSHSSHSDRSPVKPSLSVQYPNAPQQSLSGSEQSTKVNASNTKATKSRKTKLGGKSPSRTEPASIYRNVTSPYPYTESFHQFFNLCSRFRKEAVRRIAEALSRIRPSFISAAKTLVPEDLVFMEQYFQRSLLEYEGFLSRCGTPTIVCRRSGEVALSTKEFQVLAGWSQNVLLGSEPNLNTNTSAAKPEEASSLNGSGVPTATGKGGFNTPNRPRTPIESSDEAKKNGRKNQPVFLAELLDEQSVVSFYEDFARVAFADSKGSVSSPCKLLRYRPPDVSIASNVEKKRKGKMIKMEECESKVGGEEGIKKLDEDGKVNCMYCWMVKRDVFNIPMVIVINFLPIM